MTTLSSIGKTLLALLVFVFAQAGCSLVPKTAVSNFTIDKFESLKIGNSKTTEVQLALGKPNDAFFIGDNNQFVQKSENLQWIYQFRDSESLYLYFESNVLVSKSWSANTDVPENSIENILKKFKGRWVVIKEPMSNPHAGPDLCYLEDLKGGKRVEINGYTKKVVEVTVWKPQSNDKSIKEHLAADVGKEFCIASSCGKVTDPTLWNHNHCAWLEKLIAGK